MAEIEEAIGLATDYKRKVKLVVYLQDIEKLRMYYFLFDIWLNTANRKLIELKDWHKILLT